MVFAFEIRDEPNLPLELAFWHVDLLVLFKEVLNIAPRIDVIKSGDCRCDLSIKFRLFKLFKVIVVQDLNHATAEPLASLYHLDLEHIPQH